MPTNQRLTTAHSRTLIRRLSWLLMAILAIAAVLLGYIGLAKHFAQTDSSRSPLDIAYLTLQLFTLESGAVTPPVPWELEIGRILAPLAAAWAIIRALAALFSEQLLAARLRRWRGHAVVCGLGRKGIAVVRDALQRGMSVIAIESDEENDAVHTCRELGVPVILGDGTDPVLLDKARAGYASLICASAGDDGRNVEIAMKIRAAAQRANTAQPLQCFIHLVDLGLCNLLNARSLNLDQDPGLPEDTFSVRVFSVFDNAARLLLHQHPLEDPAPAALNRRPHLILIGFGRMGAAVALQAAKVCQYHDERLPRLTVIDTHAQQRQGHFYGCFPQFDKTCEASFISGHAEDAAILETLRAFVLEPSFTTTIIVCLDNDTRAMMAALRVSEYLQDLNVRILVRMAETAGLASLIGQSSSADEVLARVHPFGTIAETCGLDILLSTEIDQLAVAIHEAYCQERRDEGRAAAHPTMQPWPRLAPMYKDSNRQQADHIPVKLRAIGCHTAPLDTPGPRIQAFEPAQIELLSRMEHARWCAERYLAGWTFGPNRDDNARKHPNLVPWAQLSEDIHDYDRQSVKKIPSFLETIGQAVFPNTATP